MKYLNDKDKYIDEVSAEFNKELVDVQKSIIRQIDTLIGASYGKDLDIISRARLITEIEKKLNDILLNSKYESAVKKYLLSFDEVIKYQKLLHKSVNGISLSKVPLNEIRKAQIAITESNLLSSGVSAKFSQPIKEILTRNILVGTNVQESKDIIEKYILGDDSLGVLEKYAGQIANDTLRQFDGVINTQIKEEYNMTKISYLGSIIKTSRGQCKHWTSFDFVTEEQLQDEIPIAVNGGSLGGYQCSGMIEETTLDNFLSYRGGFNCRHNAIPIY